MTIQEMHIEVEQGTQHIAAALNRDLLPEEIDFLLNKMQDRFIAMHVKPKADGSPSFELDEVGADAMRNLIKSKQIDAVYNSKNWEIALPSDYSYLLDDASVVTNLCGAAVTLTDSSENVTSVKWNKTVHNTEFYKTIVFTSTTFSFTLADVVPVGYTGLQGKEEDFRILQFIVWYIRTVLGKEIYWERYKSIYRKSCLLIPGASTASLVVDGGAAAATELITLSEKKSTGTVQSPNRLLRSDKIFSTLNTPYYKSTWKSPVSELSGNILRVHGDDSFTVSKGVISYVRKPRKMDLLLACDCELAEEFHSAICDLAEEYFKTVTIGNWDSKLRDNQIRQPILNP